MTEEQHLLVKVMEECDEVSQRAAKGICFTLEEIQEGQSQTNTERLIHEFNDLVAVMEMLVENKSIPDFYDRDLINAKKAKVKKWMKYSKKIGQLNKD